MAKSIQNVISGKSKDIGKDFTVTRLLPSLTQRSVGPFVFWDHIGPVMMTPTFKMEVRAHPHIGLSTLTYLFAGEILHRDSLGYEQVIRPGDVNWMTAGRGIAHSERSEFNSDIEKLEGIQIWLALPKDHEEVEPSFQHVPRTDLPLLIDSEDRVITLIAGKYADIESPVRTFSPLCYLDVQYKCEGRLSLPMPKDFESALYITKGSIEADGATYEAGQMLTFRCGEDVDVFLNSDVHLLVFGGCAFPEPRFLWWNFVSTSKERIEQAKVDWKNRHFESVINEVEYIPLPDK